MKLSTLTWAGLALAIAASACSKSEDTRAGQPAATSTQNDNTGKNVRDRDPAAVLPTDQKNNDADLQITQQIRKAVVGDSALSVQAQNVKIITANGVVTLRGPVKSDAEKSSIEAKAKQAAGVTRVDNQLEVAKP